MRLHRLWVLSIFTTEPFCGIATPLPSRWDDVQEKHTWKSVPGNWENLGHPPAGTTIDFHIALKPQHENALIDALFEVSSPGHPKYGAYLSKEQVAELVAPPPDVLQLVIAWLGHYGVLPSTILIKHGGSWLTLIGVPVFRANDLLSASYQLYQHIGTNDTVLRTLSYGLPTALLAHVQTVTPTTHFGFSRTPWHKQLMHPVGAAGAQARVDTGELETVSSSRIDSEYVTPTFLRWLYKTSGYVPAATDRSALGVTGYVNQYPSLADLRLFMNEYRAGGADTTITVVHIGGGGYDPSNPGPEASLNIQYTEAMAYPTSQIFYSIGNSKPWGDPFLNWLDYVLSRQSVPQTMSTSYGTDEYYIPPDHAMYLCSLIAQLGLRGASVLFASGDDGVGRGDCSFGDASGNRRVQFVPTFPSTCPWVTSVGGTTGYEPEVAASLSGGGFSVYFPRPFYQDNVVPTFLQSLGNKYYGLYNAGGRGIPDIALQAFGYRFVFNKQPWSMKGTSCSAPTAAGIISLLNDYLLSKGRPSLGFLNPWLYGGGLEGLNDITLGSNPGCDTEGFSAIAGWDPVTGLGSLDFEKLGEILDRASSAQTTIPSCDAPASHWQGSASHPAYFTTTEPSPSTWSTSTRPISPSTNLRIEKPPESGRIHAGLPDPD